MPINRCVCCNRPFSSLLEEARERKWDFAQLVQHSGCGRQCGGCAPYLKRMLETGETSFEEILPFDETLGLVPLPTTRR